MSTSRTDALSSSPDGSSNPFQAWEPTPIPPQDYSFLIRTVRQQDLTRLAEILTDSFHPQDGMMGWLHPLLRKGIYEDLRSRLHSKQTHYACLVAVKRGPAAESRAVHLPTAAPVSQEQIIGTVEIALRPHHFYQPHRDRHLYLSNLAVQAEYRRQGIAQQLLQTCERIALDWGFQDLYLHVLENNHQARRLYLRTGYRLKRIDSSLSSWLLKRPRQLFLHKHLSRPS